MAQHKENEDFMAARIQDAMRNASLRNRPYFVGFLDLQQAALARALSARSAVQTVFWGGYEEAERVVMGAFPDEQWADPTQLPVTALEVKFRRSTELTHRDLLGSLMALGIERDTVGDILIEKGRAVLFVRRELAEHIAAQLSRVGREGVETVITDQPELPPPRALLPVSSTVASPRLDCVVAVLAHCGRSAAAEQITRGMVMQNGRISDSVSDEVAEGDILTIRGVGKFRIEALGPLTKKQRLSFRAGQYA